MGDCSPIIATSMRSLDDPELLFLVTFSRPPGDHFLPQVEFLFRQLPPASTFWRFFLALKKEKKNLLYRFRTVFSKLRYWRCPFRSRASDNRSDCFVLIKWKGFLLLATFFSFLGCPALNVHFLLFCRWEVDAKDKISHFNLPAGAIDILNPVFIEIFLTYLINAKFSLNTLQ